MDEESTQKNLGVINNKELELLVIATIQTLKWSKKKTGNEEVFNLQSVTKIMGKTAIRVISCFYPLPPLNNVEKQ